MLLMRQLKITAAVLPVLCVLAFSVFSVRAADSTSPSPEKEKELIALLKSDAAGGEKAIACKQLAIHGSSESVPELAKLLSNEQLASWARIALEAIPGSEADEALKQSVAALQGKLLVGAINSIGVRRASTAVEVLATRLEDKDPEVAAAAAVALGHIGNGASTKILREALTKSPANVRSAVAEGCIYCAERLLAGGQSDDATQIYDEVRKAEVSKPRILEATRGAILARKQAGIPLLVEQLNSDDKATFYIGLTTAREISGREVDEALAAELAKAAPERAVALVHTMADRKETVLLPVIIKAASEGPKPVRLAAINVLAKVGDATCLTPLLAVIAEGDAELTQSAQTTLADLPGEKIDGELVALLSKAEGKIYPLLIELVGQRRIEATPALLKALDNSDKTVRSAALAALGETVALKNLPVLITQVVSAKTPEYAAEAQKALKTASTRMPDRDACTEVLAQAMAKAPAAVKGTLLEIMGDVGGAAALKTLGAAAKGTDGELQDVSTRVLGKWNSVDAAPVLIDLAKNAPGDKYQVRSLRGYIGLARKFAMPEPQRAEMCQTALDTAHQTAEKKLVMDVLKLHPSPEGLKIAIKSMQAPELKADATAAVLVIGQKMSKSPEARELISKAAFDKVKLEIVKADFGAGANQKDVTEVLKKQATDIPVITLKGNYNAEFGDPVPNTVKLLKVQYKINGKAAEATFPEDGLIALPMPK